jgi:hypothetical protein
MLIAQTRFFVIIATSVTNKRSILPPTFFPTIRTGVTDKRRLKNRMNCEWSFRSKNRVPWRYCQQSNANVATLRMCNVVAFAHIQHLPFQRGRQRLPQINKAVGSFDALTVLA